MAARIRVLVATDGPDDGSWSNWQTAREASRHASRIVLQKASRSAHVESPRSVGLGYAETLRWFGPVESATARHRIIQYAEAVLDADEFPPPTAELSALVLLPANGPQSVPREVALTEGIVFLTHAQTDLLALERARSELPEDFPSLTGISLNGICTPGGLVALLGEKRSARLLAIVRVHGEASSVAGLEELLDLARQEGWSVVVVSGVGSSALPFPRTADITAEMAENLTTYFMAGGVGNVVQALRYAAHESLGLSCDFEPPRAMPAHGLYHPDLLVTDEAEWRGYRAECSPVAVFVFYRAHVLSGNLYFVDEALRTLERRGFAAIGVFTSSLRECDASGTPVALRLLREPPDVIVNTVSYPVLTLTSLEHQQSGLGVRNSFETLNAPLIQAICCGMPRDAWSSSPRGLSPTEAAMNVVLPECDGRVITVPISFKEHHRYVPDVDRVKRVADFARRHAVLRHKRNGEKRIAVVLGNSGGKAQKVGGAVGLDTPASLLRWLTCMRDHGYSVGELPPSADVLMTELLARGCYDEKCPIDPASALRMTRRAYSSWFGAQPEGFRKPLRNMWGEPGPVGPTLAPPFWRSDRPSTQGAMLLALHEPFTDRDDYLFGGVMQGNVCIAIQPPRSFGLDADAAYHDPDLPPCHHYAAFYRWLADVWRADAVIHFGAHGTLEWLPGKSLALSADCAPDALLGDLPLFYPFVVNNPGEGAQAKRRTHAVIVDHLVPPLTQAQLQGPLEMLARLVEEYYRAEVMDPGKLALLRAQVWELVQAERLDVDLKQIRGQRHADHQHGWDDRLTQSGIPRALENLSGRTFAHLLEDLDAYLCDLGRAQIRDGLHVFGQAPTGRALVDLIFAILRSPNGDIPALIDAVAGACAIEPPMLHEGIGRWTQLLAPALALGVNGAVTAGQVRTAVDRLAYELLEELAAEDFADSCVERVVDGKFAASQCKDAVADLLKTLRFVCEVLAPNLARTTDETANLLRALSGGYVPAGPSGAPSRGMAHVLPTGRNFYTVDPRAVPTPAAWVTGSGLADAALARFYADSNRWPESIALTVWGTPTMRTGGDEIAQALALIGVKPRWDPQTRRTSGVEIIPLPELRRPRIDVVLRVSGFFRDAFPGLMQLFAEAVQQVLALDESPDDNYLRKHWLAETAIGIQQGTDSTVAARQCAYRVFSSKPGAYGTGLLDLVDRSGWQDPGELAAAAMLFGGWAYTGGGDAVEAVGAFRDRLAGVQLVLQTQDSREQDLFDSTDHFEFHGGLINAVAALSNTTPAAYCGDSSDPSRPRVRTLQGEVLRVYRSRVVNPKWLDSIRRHGYRGGLEMAVTVDCLFGFAATAGVVTDWMFEQVAESYTAGESRQFLQRSNPWALNAIAERLLEAAQRQLWVPQPDTLEALRETALQSEATIEQHSEDRA